MKTIVPDKLKIYSELAMRATLNFSRLERDKYWPETIFSMDQNAWPADWEGRTMLALTMLSQTTGTVPAFLDDILDETIKNINEKGYIGPVVPEGKTHEQTMSGHSWMIRALVEYHNWKMRSDSGQAGKALHILKSIIDNLYLPQVNNYADYPVTFTDRQNSEYWILSDAIEPNWKDTEEETLIVTSDVGCAFISLDGATAAYELLPGSPLKNLIETMITSFTKLPFEKLHVQTHATLSGIRGLLRWHRITGNQTNLEFALQIFDRYKTQAWTSHYANYNWFGLPSWTEPCAIVDSFIISQEIWEATNNENYLKDAHHILYNAIAHAQRANGAFGTDFCVGANTDEAEGKKNDPSGDSDQVLLFARSHIYEVFWCCNMRGGDGLSRAALYSFYIEENSIIMPYYHSCKAELELEKGSVILKEQANYPLSGEVIFDILENSAGMVAFKFFAPAAWTAGAASRILLNGEEIEYVFENDFLIVNLELKSGDNLVLNTDMKFYTFNNHECVNNSKDHFSFRHGPMMLGVKSVLNSEEVEPVEINIPRDAEKEYLGNGRYSIGGQTLQPMWGRENMIEPLDIYQILFSKT